MSEENFEISFRVYIKCRYTSGYRSYFGYYLY